ncbi:MAG: EpsI family protein [Sedimentisphaerales bacterium]|nr:EpsI family protein [Sedimentisphaerales bacterium]
MIKSDNSNRKSVAVAAIAAGLVIIVFSAAYNVLAARLATPMNITLLTSAELELLPLDIGDWTGREVPLDEEIVRATDTDAYVNRIYSRRNDTEHISLYIAYGGRARDLMPHRPEVCYTGAGWTRIDSRSLKLSLRDETELPCNIFQFTRGTLNNKKTVVLDYYIVDGQYYRDVSGLRFKVWRGSGTVRYVAQVQIVSSTSVNLNASSAEKIVCSFAAESAPLISRLFESTGDTQLSNETRLDPKHILGETARDE